ncbi:MAG: glycosyl hydrolase family 28-related protein, partial [Burkholderiales bacterium]
MKRQLEAMVLALASLALLASAAFGHENRAATTRSSHYDVRDYGATGDGRTLDTAAINRAIAAAADAGGGTVVFPAGDYLSFSIRLKSHITLHLGPGATLIAAEPPADLSHGYDPPEPNPGNDQYQDFGHSHWHNSLIWGEGLENIAITGTGRIYGLGLSRQFDRRDLLPRERALPKAQRPDVSLPAALAASIAATVKP